MSGHKFDPLSRKKANPPMGLPATLSGAGANLLGDEMLRDRKEVYAFSAEFHQLVPVTRQGTDIYPSHGD
eukprot:5464988-Amphidinium_carterae.1